MALLESSPFLASLFMSYAAGAGTPQIPVASEHKKFASLPTSCDSFGMATQSQNDRQQAAQPEQAEELLQKKSLLEQLTARCAEAASESQLADQVLLLRAEKDSAIKDLQVARANLDILKVPTRTAKTITDPLTKNQEESASLMEDMARKAGVDKEDVAVEIELLRKEVEKSSVCTSLSHYVNS